MASQLSAASPPTFTIEESTVAQLQRAMADGKLTAVELVSYYIARIEQFDPVLNAFISVNRKAVKVAAELDEERSQGITRGPLHGIPIVIKDNINTADMPTTGGCAALADLQPAEDAFVVARLREAGAIVLGKANLHELACSGESVSSLGGQVRNPYQLDYTPGGSSGGTAVAIAANLAVCGLGSDTINSVRSPASACNIVGLRPTAGRVSRSGLMPVSLTQDVIGPMGRRVADVAVLLEAISADDPDDPMTARSAGHPVGQLGSDERDGYQSALNSEGLVGKRLGIVPSLWGAAAVHAPVNKVVDEAIATMELLGAQVVELAVHIDIDQMLSELSLNLWEGKLHLNHYFESLGDSAPVKTLKMLLEAEKERGVHPSIKPTLEEMEAIDTPLGSSEYWQRLYPRRAEIRQFLANLFKRYQIDALIYPHQRRTVARIGESQKERNGFLAVACGFPAITFPIGFVSIPDGELPVGIELMAQPFEEGQLLQMAYAYEQHAQVRRAPSLSAADLSNINLLGVSVADTEAAAPTDEREKLGGGAREKEKAEQKRKRAKPRTKRVKSESVKPESVESESVESESVKTENMEFESVESESVESESVESESVKSESVKLDDSAPKA